MQLNNLNFIMDEDLFVRDRSTISKLVTNKEYFKNN